jgi:hypothetical protein
MVGPEVALNWLFPYPLISPPPKRPYLAEQLVHELRGGMCEQPRKHSGAARALGLLARGVPARGALPPRFRPLQVPLQGALAQRHEMLAPLRYGDAKGANRNVGDFGWGIAHAAPAVSPRHDGTPYPGATRTTLGFGICPSFKDHSLSRRAKPQRYDSRLFHRCRFTRRALRGFYQSWLTLTHTRGRTRDGVPCLSRKLHTATSSSRCSG